MISTENYSCSCTIFRTMVYYKVEPKNTCWQNSQKMCRYSQIKVFFLLKGSVNPWNDPFKHHLPNDTCILKGICARCYISFLSITVFSSQTIAFCFVNINI